MIKSFSCKDTKTMYEGKRIARFANIETIAMRKLAMLSKRSANTTLTAQVSSYCR